MHQLPPINRSRHADRILRGMKATESRVAELYPIENLGAGLRFARLLLGMSQRDVAQASSMARQQLNRYELGRVIPSMPSLAVVMATLHLDLARLHYCTRRAEGADLETAGLEAIAHIAELQALEAGTASGKGAPRLILPGGVREHHWEALG